MSAGSGLAVACSLRILSAAHADTYNVCLCLQMTPVPSSAAEAAGGIFICKRNARTPKREEIVHA